MEGPQDSARPVAPLMGTRGHGDMGTWGHGGIGDMGTPRDVTPLAHGGAGHSMWHVDTRACGHTGHVDTRACGQKPGKGLE